MADIAGRFRGKIQFLKLTTHLMKKEFLFQSTLLLLFIFLAIMGIYYAQGFLIPLIIAMLLAMVLLPMNRRLEKWKVPRIISIILSLFTIIAIISGILFLFYTQIASLSEDIPVFRNKITEKFEQLRLFIETQTNIPATQQMSWIEKRYHDIVDSSGQYLSALFMGISGALATFSIIIVYILFFLLYRGRLYNFVLRLTPEENHDKVILISNKIIALIQHYLIGLLIELAVLGTLNAVGLLIIGIRQAIFFGYLAGLLNIIPYIGTLIGSLFPILMALVFKESFSAVIAVAGLMIINQFIDNNFLTPKIIGSHVRLNPLVTIMVIVIGGLLWGVAGMILFIPLLGILKIICDNISWLGPYGYLMGDDEITDEKRATNSFFKKLFSVRKESVSE
jgi:AI-2 transport protein TqsA